MTNRSSTPRANPTDLDAKHHTSPAALDKGCDLWGAYEWRFNLPKGQRLRGSTLVGLAPCQGSRIRRKVYTLTERRGEFRMCRVHQVEVGSLKRVTPK